jgi:hypothetical protein
MADPTPEAPGPIVACASRDGADGTAVDAQVLGNLPLR